MKKILFLLVVVCIFQLSVSAQYSVGVGNASGNWDSIPCTNRHEYSWAATIYKQSDIQSHGDITDIFYKSHFDGVSGPGANKFMFNQRIFMQAVADDEFSTTAFPDTNQMTLVFAGTVQFLNYEFAQIHLDASFTLPADKNLMILYVNKNGYKDMFGEYLSFPVDRSETTNRTVYRNLDGSFAGGTGTFSTVAPEVYLKYAPGLDAGVSAIQENEPFILPQQTDLTCRFRNYMADTLTSLDIEWELNGTPQPVYSWTGNSYCGTETPPVVLQNNFDFAPGQYTIKANTTHPNAGVDALNTNDTLEVVLNVTDERSLAYQSWQDNTIPFLSNRSYGWSVSIYHGDSIGLSGKIHSIAYYVTNAEGMVEPNQKIFMRTTTDQTNPSTAYPDTTQFERVYYGDIDYTGTGWHIIKLDTPFTYNDAENLMILYENHAGKATIQATYFKTGWHNTNAVYNYDLNSFPTGAGSVATGSRIPAVQLYFSIPKDAGAVRLHNSDVPWNTGVSNVVVDVKNFGVESISDLDIKYRIDNGSVKNYHWSGTVNPLYEIQNLTVGSDNFTYGDHTLEVWTENPDFLTDYAPQNDTLHVTLRACTPLSGTYTVGGTIPDFAMLKDAVDSLNHCGVSGPVTFNIRPGTYNDQYSLESVLGASSQNTITFRAEDGDSTGVVLTTDSTDYLFRLYGAHHIILKNLSFQSDQAAALVLLDSANSDIQCSGSLFSSATSNEFIRSETGFNQKNLVVEHNLFTGGATAIDLNQADRSEITGFTISDNEFTGQTDKCIRVYFLNQGEIRDNHIVAENVGIHLNKSDNIDVSANRIEMHSADKGIYFDRSLNVLISNNFIAETAQANQTAIYAMGDGNPNIIRIYHNSVHLDNGYCAVYLNSLDTAYVLNNILINSQNQVLRYFSLNFFSNHNGYYSDGAVFGSLDGDSNIPDYLSWVAHVPQDSNSVFINPYFTSVTDLHTASGYLDNKGAPVPEVTTDIDGEMRDPVNPDIGADEFTSNCTGPLAGTYTIGATGDYPTLTDAVMALYNCGIRDTVEFKIQTGVYNEQVEINGAYLHYEYVLFDTVNYPVTFQSLSGDSSDVLIQYSGTASKNYVLMLDGVQNFSVKNLSLKALDPVNGRVVVLKNHISNLLLANNQIMGIENPGGGAALQCIYTDQFDASPDDTLDVIIRQNLISDGTGGIVFDYGSGGSVRTNLIIDQNRILNQNQNGIFVRGAKYLQQITRNIIRSDQDPSRGISIYYSDTVLISGNQIILTTRNNCYGIEQYSTNNEISNNMVSIQAQEGANTTGYYSTWPSQLYHNTFYVYGDGGSFSYGVQLSNFSVNCTLENNNIVNLNGPVLSISKTSPPNLVSDYNNLYPMDVLSWSGTTGQDVHSVSFMPDFVSNTDLHTHAALLNGKGTPSSLVTDDIDGEPRDAINPDIGADEFDNPVFTAGRDTVFCYYTDKFDQPGSYTYDIGYGYDSYLWSTGSDSSSIAIDTSSTAPGDNEYVVTVSTGGNNYSDTISILFDLPIAIDQTEYCQWNTPVTLTANPGYKYYDWGMGDDTIQSITKDCIGCSYDLVVTDDHGCFSKRETIHIHGANDNYPANMGLQDTVKLCTNHTLELSGNQYSGTDVYDLYSFTWGTGDTTQTVTLDGSTFTPGVYPFDVTVYLVNDTLCFSHDTVNINVDPCAGVGEMEQTDVIVYPNPVSDRIYVNFNNPVRHTRIIIYDILGKVIWQSGEDEPVALQKEMDVSSIPAGIYLLRIQADNRVYQQKLIIK